MESKSDYISICADDDRKKPNFLKIALSHSDFILFSTGVELRSYIREEQRFADYVISETSFQWPSSNLEIAHKVWPTFFFGLWSGDWIRSNYPEKDYDWLDCSLIHRAMIQGGFQSDFSEKSIVCGFDPKRKSWAVDGSKHSMEGYLEFFLDSLINSRGITKLFWKHYVLKKFLKNQDYVNGL